MVKIPPVGTNFSVLNCRCEGREKFFGSGADLVAGVESEDEEETGRGGRGHRVISVLCVTGWNVAKEIAAADLVGPECRRMSGLAEATVGGEVSC